jgi:phage gp29-like protein
VLGNDTTTNIGEMIGSTNIVGAGSASEMIKSGTTAEGITPASTQLFYNSADSNDKFFYRMIEAKKYSHNTSGYVDLNSLTTSGDGATAGTVGWD